MTYIYINLNQIGFIISFFNRPKPHGGENKRERVYKAVLG